MDILTKVNSTNRTVTVRRKLPCERIIHKEKIDPSCSNTMEKECVDEKEVSPLQKYHYHFFVSSVFMEIIKSEKLLLVKNVFSEQFFDRADRILFRNNIYLRRRNGVEWSMKCRPDSPEFCNDGNQKIVTYYEFHSLPKIIFALWENCACVACCKSRCVLLIDRVVSPIL